MRLWALNTECLFTVRLLKAGVETPPVVLLNDLPLESARAWDSNKIPRETNRVATRAKYFPLLRRIGLSLLKFMNSILYTLFTQVSNFSLHSYAVFSKYIGNLP